MKVAVAQLGARMHFAVPAVLEGAGRLERLHTDVAPGKGVLGLARALSRLPGASGLRRLAGRAPGGVPAAKVSAHNAFGLAYALRRARARTPEAEARANLWAGRAFCRLLKRADWGAATHTFAYNTAGLEWMLAAKARGLVTVLEQTIAPREEEIRLMALERDRHPDWERPSAAGTGADPGGPIRELCDREREEWKAADLILGGSAFVKDALGRCGGPAERCVVVPYGVDAPARTPRTPRPRTDGPLRVLTVGAVGLRKGSPTVLKTARLCGERCAFRMVGPLNAGPAALAGLARAVTLTGPVPRQEVAGHYDWADVFFLPSVCEGSATAVYEALARGLPVLTTPNAGSVVTHGVDGWLAEPGAAEAMAAVLLDLEQRRDRLAALSAAALVKARGHDVASYGRGLLAALDGAPGA